MNILSDSTPVSEAKEIWEPSWNVGMEAVKDYPRENLLEVEDEVCLDSCPGQGLQATPTGNLLDVEDEVCQADCSQGLQTTDGQQYFASWLASKVKFLFVNICQ